MGGLWLGTWARAIIGNRLAPFVPTPPHVADRMLALAQLRPGETVADLGCGEGGLLLRAAQRHAGVRAVGYELNAELVLLGRQKALAAGLQDAITIHQACAKQADLHGVDVVLLFVSEHGNAALLPALRSAGPAARICSFTFPIPSLTPAKTDRVDGIDLFLYRGVGAAAAGA